MDGPINERLFSNETGFEAFIRKCKEQPAVPLGTLATAGVLIGGLVKFGSAAPAKQQQKYMRARVFAQGVTVIAIGVGGLMARWDTFGFNQPTDSSKSSQEE